MITILWCDPDDDDCIEETRDFDCWSHEMDEFVDGLLIEGQRVRMLVEDDEDDDR